MALTWADSATARRVSSWGVSREETLSDHLYIRVSIIRREAITRKSVARRNLARKGIGSLPRWSSARCDEDLRAAAAMAITWGTEAPSTETADAMVDRLGRGGREN